MRTRFVQAVFAVLFMSMMIGMSRANILTPIGQYNVSSDKAILNTSMLVNNSIYAITFDSGSVVKYDLQAVGGTATMVLTNSLTANHWTIPNNGTFWDHIPEAQGKNYTLYFYTASAPVTIECVYTYR